MITSRLCNTVTKHNQIVSLRLARYKMTEFFGFLHNISGLFHEGDLHCQCILSIFPASVHQFYANILVFVTQYIELGFVSNNPFLYNNDQFALIDDIIII